MSLLSGRTLTLDVLKFTAYTNPLRPVTGRTLTLDVLK